MGLTVAMIDALVNAGVTTEQLAALVKVDLQERDQATEARRAKDAERQRRHRESRDVTVTDGDSEEIPAPSLSPQTPQTHPHPCKNTPRARKGTRLPADWTPKPLPTSLAASVAEWPSGAAEREIDRFRDWAASATGSVAVKSDWDAAWRNWLRKADEDGRHLRRPPNGTGPPSVDPMIASILSRHSEHAQ